MTDDEMLELLKHQDHINVKVINRAFDKYGEEICFDLRRATGQILAEGFGLASIILDKNPHLISKYKDIWPVEEKDDEA